MKVLIVEDERIAARRLERMTREILGDGAGPLDVTCIERIEDSRAYLGRNDIDLVLLDLNLNGKDGFELLKEAAAGAFQTIVVSANTDQALRAFEFGVLDFVPKPVVRERLERALERLGGPQAVAGAGTAPARYLSVKRLGAIYLLAVEQVLYLKGAGDYVEVHMKDGQNELHSKSLEALEKILPEKFSRVHKSFIVDMTQVRQVMVHGGGKYELELEGGVKVPLSRTRYRSLSAQLSAR